MNASVSLILFALNTLLILLDAALGYRLAPRLMARLNNPELSETAVRSTRQTLSAVVALYMFFNCLGYFTPRQSWLLVVPALALTDMGLQYWLVRRSSGPGDDGEPQ